jgi:hypothetical protein
MACDQTPGGWVGWKRLNGAKAWETVTYGRTEREASEKLWDYSLPKWCRHRETVVLPAGEDPNKRKRHR